MPYKNLPESEWGKMDKCVEQVQGKGHDKESAIAICYTSLTGKEYSGPHIDLDVEALGDGARVYEIKSGVTIKQCASLHDASEYMIGYKAGADVNNLPDSAFLHVEAGGENDESGKTVPRSLRHLPYKNADGGIDLPTLRNALSRLGQPDTGTAGGDRWLTATLRKELIAKAQKILSDNTDAASAQGKEAKPSLFEQIVNAITGKEGRRNSGSDADRLQQIHDLSVENGAACPMVLKQANGKHRWILLSTNAYRDRDGEIVSQKAQDADVERMNATKNFGPLRLWHMGYPDVATKDAGPGVDIGDCDYSQMFGRIRVESGTFRDERTAAAIKGRADQWAGSIGFFHPLDQPDQSGVYEDSHTFERSLLPRGKASNYLTPLAAIVKENDMTTKEEKVKQLTDLLGDSTLAAAVLKQVDATEKAAQEQGLKFKEQIAKEPAKPEPPAKDTPAEEGKEPKKEAASEPDYEAMAKGLAPHFEKMMKTYMEAQRKEQTTKEATLEASVKELTAQVKELTGDLPRGFGRGFRPSQSEATLLKDAQGNPIKLKDAAPSGDPMDSVIDQLIKGSQFMPPPGVATPPAATP